MFDNTEQAGDQETTLKALQKLKELRSTTQEPLQFQDFQEIGAAPELNEFSMPAFKASAGLLMAGNESGAKGIIEEQFPNANVRQGDEGLLVDLPSGTYRLRGPAQFGAGLAAQMGAFILGGGLMGGAKTLGGRVASQALGAGAVQTGLELGEEALGGEDASPQDVAVAAVVGGAMETLPSIWRAGRSAAQDRAFRKAAIEAAPAVQSLKNGAREIYKQIDDLGASLKPESMQNLSSRLFKKARESGFNKRIHPKVSAALDEFEIASGDINTLSNVDVLRRVANSARNSLDPDEARVGSIIVDEIDSFLDAVKPSDLVAGTTKDVSKLYQQSRDLWGRARKSELVQEAMFKAKNQASGFENGLRTQFRSILNNKRKRKMFTKEEIDAFQKVVQGGGAENIAKAIGKFGFTEGHASSMLLSSLGVAGGAQVGGPVGAVLVPGVGQVSKKLAQTMTRGNAEFADAIVRAGPDANKIISSYLKFVPTKSRNPADLASLLMNNKDAMKQAHTLSSVPLKGPSKLNLKVVKDALFHVKNSTPAIILQSSENN